MTKEPGKQKPSIDLASLDATKAANAGFEFEIRHPTANTGLGMYITVMGADSDDFREAIRENVARERQRAFMAQKKGRVPEPKTAEEDEREAVDILVVATIGWRGIEFEGVKDLPFNVENARKLYTKLRWLRKQVDAEIGDLSNFIKV